MCVTAVIAAVTVVASAVGTMASISAANAQKAQGRYLGKIEQKQARERRESARLQAIEQENGRAAIFAQQRSSALAAVGASGLGENMSFAQGIDLANAENFRDDVRAIRLNLYQEEATIADQIQVSEYGVRISDANAASAKLGAVANFVGDVAGAASYYQKNNTPAPSKAQQKGG